MKRTLLLLILLTGAMIPLACSDNNPNPSAPTAPAVSGATATPTFTNTLVVIGTPGTVTATPTFSSAAPTYMGAFGITSAPNGMFLSVSGSTTFLNIAENDGVLPMMEVFDVTNFAAVTESLASASNFMVLSDGTTVLMQGPQGVVATGTGGAFTSVLDVTKSGSATIYTGFGLPSGPLTVSAWGTRAFKNPKGFTGDYSTGGHLYMADTDNAYVQEFDTLGSPGSFPLHEWNAFYSGAVTYLFVKPVAVACDTSNNVFVGDIGYSPNLISEFTSGGVTYINSFSTVANCQIRGMALDPSGNSLYVADFGNKQVEEYNTTTGALIRAWGLPQSAYMTYPFGPSAIALAYTGATLTNIFVGDYSNQQIVMFGP